MPDTFMCVRSLDDTPEPFVSDEEDEPELDSAARTAKEEVRTVSILSLSCIL